MNRISYVCTRSAELRKEKSNKELSQKEAFTIANKEFLNNE